MYEGLIVRRSAAELRRAAARGMAYYSCERFEDASGRLAVGIGAKLEGRALKYVAQFGREAFYVSPVALREDMGCRSDRPPGFGSGKERHGCTRIFTDHGETGSEPSSEDLDFQSRSHRRRLGTDGETYPDVWDKTCTPDRKVVGEAMQAVRRICPEAVTLIQALRPYPRDLIHGVDVATCARRMMEAFNRARQDGSISSAYPYSARVREAVFLAGLMHDIGRWKGRPAKGHAACGAELLKKQSGNAGVLYALAGVVSKHHEPLSRLTGRTWKVHKAAPVVIAEAVLEFPGPRTEAVCRLAAEEVTEGAKALMICLCNMEGVVPPQAVVRIRAGVQTGAADELAVSLRMPEGDPSGLCLLRFARVEATGQPAMLWRPGEREGRVASYLTVSGHPGHVAGKQTVVGLLSRQMYEQRFGRYERLVPALPRQRGRQNVGRGGENHLRKSFVPPLS